MEVTERFFKSWDGADLFYRAWIPTPAPNKALLLFHRGHEHSGRWQETVESLRLNDVAVFAWDARGHGRSPGARGDANHLVDLVKDVNAFSRHVSERNGIPIEDMIVLAHSLAAVVVTAWVHDFAPPIRAMILATAAFDVKLYVPFAIPALRMFRRGHVTSYVKAKMLTHDAAQVVRYERDPLIFRQIAVRMLLDLHDTAKRLLADAGAIQTPTLMIAAGRDWIVNLKAQRTFFERLSSRIKQFRVFEGMYHSIFHETNRKEVVDLIRDFVCEQFGAERKQPSLLKADQAGNTYDEYKRLQRNGSVTFAMARLGLGTVGRLSHGIDLGWRNGFDSGLSLDYVYRNRPAGALGLGQLIDRSYLNSIGWKGIRQRKANVETALLVTIKRIHKSGGSVNILDIAAGAGRYVLETLSRVPDVPASVVLSDYKQENVEAARELATQLGLPNVNVKRGDAFDRASLAATEPRTTIGIVSGLYELFPSNEMVLNSLRGLATAIEPGGYLIYTNQPWHPQIEFIAHVLRNREGRPWIMRRRTTAEMDELVCVAGFDKIDMEIDQWGMFTVSIARRCLDHAENGDAVATD